MPGRGCPRPGGNRAAPPVRGGHADGPPLAGGIQADDSLQRLLQVRDADGAVADEEVARREDGIDVDHPRLALEGRDPVLPDAERLGHARLLEPVVADRRHVLGTRLVHGVTGNAPQLVAAGAGHRRQQPRHVAQVVQGPGQERGVLADHVLRNGPVRARVEPRVVLGKRVHRVRVLARADHHVDRWARDALSEVREPYAEPFLDGPLNRSAGLHAADPDAQPGDLHGCARVAGPGLFSGPRGAGAHHQRGHGQQRCAPRGPRHGKREPRGQGSRSRRSPTRPAMSAPSACPTGRRSR